MGQANYWPRQRLSGQLPGGIDLLPRGNSKVKMEIKLRVIAVYQFVFFTKLENITEMQESR